MMKIKPIHVNGKKMFEVFIQVRNKNGKQMAKRRRYPTRKKAEREAYQLMAELEGTRNHYTWDAWVNECLKQIRITFRNSTYINYSGTLEKWVTPYWKDRFLPSITPTDVYEVVFENIEGVSANTRKGILKIIKKIFNMAVAEGLIHRNPAIGLKVKVPETHQKVLSADEVHTLLAEAQAVGHRFYEVWALAVFTGMRSGELYSLRWCNVDLDAGFIHVVSSWSNKNGFGPTKSARNRVVPISSSCKLLLKSLKAKTGSSEFVLPRLREWTSGEQAKVLKSFCEGIGITVIKFHDLRATFITQMLRNAVAVAKVMSIVGHAELKTTQGYLRLCGQDVAGATEKLGLELPSQTKGDLVHLFGEKS